MRSSGRLALALLVTAMPAVAERGWKNLFRDNWTVYGQISPVVLSFDDGFATQTDLADSSASTSRIGLKTERGFGTGTLEFTFETELGLRETDEISQTNEPGVFAWDRDELRKFDFTWKTDEYGTISFGQGSMASDGIAYADLSGTTLANSVDAAEMVDSFEFRRSDGTLSGIEIGDTFSTFDGPRLTRLRYDSPSLGDFVVSTSAGVDILDSDDDNETFDATLRYSKKNDGIKIEGRLGAIWTRRPAADNGLNTVGSISALHRSGFNVTLAVGDSDEEPSYYYIKLGYRADLIDVGETRISLDYHSASDFVSSGSTSEASGVSVVQDFDGKNVQAFMAYRHLKFYEVTAPSYKDAGFTALGLRWSF